MSHVASVCVCYEHTGELYKTVEQVEMPFGGGVGQTRVSLMNHASDGYPDPPGKGHF